ncbi:MAG: Uma2 family endonuclease [Deltaproteobacteria bacterium]|nr:Uma2 family endonuclease [Deltaproteobacteria bacterium]
MALAVNFAQRLFSRHEFQHMVESGLFASERVELLEGMVVSMSPQNTPHATTVNRLNYQFMRLCGAEVYIRVQSPVTLDEFNQPEPDLVLCAVDPLDYAEGHPRPEQIFLVVEIADTSLAQDRRFKARLYARTGIARYWLVDLVHRRVEVMTEPDMLAGQYRRVRIFKERQTIELPWGQHLAVVDMLPAKIRTVK